MADSILDLGTESTIFTREPDWAGPVDVTTELKREILQNPPSAVDINWVNTFTKGFPLSFEMQFTNARKSDEYELLDFFIDRQGRLKRFWCPYWINAFRLWSNITNGSSTIQIAPILYWPVKINLYQRIFIYTKTGDLITRRISAYAAFSDLEQITLASPMDRALTQSDIAFFSFMPLVRFDIDKLELEHTTSNTSSCSVRFVELLGEYNNVGY